MAIVRFVHAADLHLDSPFRGLREVEPAIGAELREATFAAYDKIIDLCLAERVDALLVAGDIYDARDRSLRAQLRFRDGLQRLADAGIRSFVCHGNHDPLDGWEAQIDMPEGCRRFGSEVEAAPLDPNEPDAVVVYGVSFPQQDVYENLARRFRRDARHLYAIGLLHANVGSDSGHEPYAPCTVEDLERSGMDYWALGHVHTRRVLREHDPVVVYPGNPQGRHRRESGARGVALVDVGNDRQTQVQFRDVDVVRWETIVLSIAELSGEQQLLETLDERLDEIATADRHAVVVVRLIGRGALHYPLRRGDTAEDLRARLNDSLRGRDPFVWCAAVEVETAPPFDRAERRQAQDFLADILRLVDEVQAGETPPAWLRAPLATLYEQGKPRRYLGRDPVTDAELLQLLDRAEERCVEALLATEDDSGATERSTP